MNHPNFLSQKTMKDKLGPTAIEDVTPPEDQNKWDAESSSSDNPIGISDEYLDSLGQMYTREIGNRILDKTDRIICLPWLWEICHETGLNFNDASDLHAAIVEYVQDLLLWWIEWDWIGIDGVVSEDGIMFKNVRVSHMDN